MIERSTSCVKHGGDNVMMWTCMTASETDSLQFIDGMTADRGIRMNFEV